MIAEAAYFVAERRGFAPGYAMDDWLQAEQEIEASMEPTQTIREMQSQPP